MKGWNPRVEERHDEEGSARSATDLKERGVLLIEGKLRVSIPSRSRATGFNLLGGIAQGPDQALTDTDITVAVHSFCDALATDILAAMLGPEGAAEGYHSVVENLDPHNPKPD